VRRVHRSESTEDTMKTACLTLLALPAACAPDLPWRWEDAEGIDDFTQEECEGSIYDTGWESTVDATADDPGLHVVGDNLPFRCDQEVEGFYRMNGTQVAVLVQPVDMDPEKVAMCDCLYTVEAGIPEDPPASVTLYWRHDNQNEPNDPVLVGSVRVAR
jgi:hypothetical protein